MEPTIRELKIGYDMLPQPVLLVRKEEGAWRCLYANPAAAALPDTGALLARMAAVLDDPPTDTALPHWTGELGGRLYVALTAPSAEGTTLVAVRDVTEERRVQQERLDAARAALQSALDAATAASRAKSDFLSNMSHDIRTPLNAIIGMTTIAQAHLDDAERIADCLGKIGMSSRHLLNLINDILDMSRIESGKMTLNPEPFTMADFIHSLMAVIQPQADKKRLRLKLDFTGIRCENVRGDQLRIHQVLINILSNAVKFTPEDGVISITVRETERPYTASAGYAFYEFIIQDTGIGMSPEFLTKMFQPFERASEASRIEGTGLGMTITHNLVEMMNGDIAVESREGQGTRFTVTLPLEQLAVSGEGEAELRGLRVLAADSDGASLHHLQETLEDVGMVCDICPNVPAALDLAAQAQTSGRDYFAIILGWRMPVIDGVQGCRELRAILGRDIPILIASSFEWTLTGDEMRKYGITGFIPKPYFRSRLVDTLTGCTAGGKARRAAAQEEDEPFAGRHVLLTEDNEINREIAVELLDMLGASADCAENGREAVDMFSAAPEGTYDLIFMDLQMPVMDGYAATRAIRALPRPDSGTIPIVAMTANAFVEDIRACEQAGMNAHLAKPISLQQLVDVMKQQLG